LVVIFFSLWFCSIMCFLTFFPLFLNLFCYWPTRKYIDFNHVNLKEWNEISERNH
jgi:hypothetical protein